MLKIRKHANDSYIISVNGNDLQYFQSGRDLLDYLFHDAEMKLEDILTHGLSIEDFRIIEIETILNDR